ncbi:ATP-binding cassette sub-family G member 1, partial [Araneus ventricosus]
MVEEMDTMTDRGVWVLVSKPLNQKKSLRKLVIYSKQDTTGYFLRCQHSIAIPGIIHWNILLKLLGYLGTTRGLQLNLSRILFPAIYCGIVYWMTAQPNDRVRFDLFILSSIMISLVAQFVGFLIGVATSVQNDVFLAPVVLFPILLFSGLFIRLDTIPYYLQWLSYISYVRYCYQSVLRGIYALDRPELHCDKICPFQGPQDFLREMDKADGNLYVDYAAMWVFNFVFRVISYYVLYYKIVYNR